MKRPQVMDAAFDFFGYASGDQPWPRSYTGRLHGWSVRSGSWGDSRCRRRPAARLSTSPWRAASPRPTIGGDIYDSALDQNTLHVSITEAMGHDTAFALLATLTVNALRGARRAGLSLLDQAYAGHQAITNNASGMTTGQLLRIQLESGVCELVNAAAPGLTAARHRRGRTAPQGQSAVGGHPPSSPTRYSDCGCRTATDWC
jgi:hypothetical protein